MPSPRDSFRSCWYGQPSTYFWWDAGGRRAIHQGDGCEQGDTPWVYLVTTPARAREALDVVTFCIETQAGVAPNPGHNRDVAGLLLLWQRRARADVWRCNAPAVERGFVALTACCARSRPTIPRSLQHAVSRRCLLVWEAWACSAPSVPPPLLIGPPGLTHCPRCIAELAAGPAAAAACCLLPLRRAAYTRWCRMARPPFLARYPGRPRQAGLSRQAQADRHGGLGRQAGRQAGLSRPGLSRPGLGRPV